MDTECPNPRLFGVIPGTDQVQVLPTRRQSSALGLEGQGAPQPA
jgi:hypothetical protein